MELKLTSQGYPTPKVRWLDGTGTELSNETLTELWRDRQGLYTISSSLTQERGRNSTLTFILLNKDLDQEIRREFSLQSGKERARERVSAREGESECARGRE